MGDEIAQIQQTIASIAERIDASQPRPELRLPVAYRDRGDAYVTRYTISRLTWRNSARRCWLPARAAAATTLSR
ncbi:MAG: hypothetical protein U0074_12295 [Kouleothrix sp.]